MKTRLATIATTMGLALGLTVVGAPAAQGADGPCTVNNFGPRYAVVGLSPVTKTFAPSISGCAAEHWVVTTDVGNGDGLVFTTKSAPQEVFTVNQSDEWYLENADAGFHDVIVGAWNHSDPDTTPSGERVFENGFQLLHRTTWQSGSFNAGPEPAKKGSQISLGGRLLVANWDQNRYVGYANRSIRVEFKSAPGAPWTLIKRVGTGADGWVRTTVPANATGAWRLRYGGTAIAAPAATHGDAVEVIG